MLDVRCKEKMLDTITFAMEHGCLGALAARLAYLSSYGSERGMPENTCVLLYDRAPHSFEFTLLRPNGAPFLVGGLIYSAPAIQLDGAAPTFTVSVEDAPAQDHTWSVHT